MKDFVPYNEALKLKELGFNEPCIFGYNDYHVLRSKIASSFDGDFVKWNEKYDRDLKAPLYQQAFRFFREKYQWQSYIEPTSDQHSRELGYNYYLWNYKTGEEYNTMPQNCPSGDWEFEKYEDAELACLIKLIEINS
jgi:hypothetical protein